jgi:hypothetical protein
MAPDLRYMDLEQGTLQFLDNTSTRESLGTVANGAQSSTPMKTPLAGRFSNF